MVLFYRLTTANYLMPPAQNLIMIADADPYVREMVSRFLTEAGYEVTTAVDGYDALDNARRALPRAILADILLPRLDGLALCRLLKGDPDTQEIVTVVVFSVLAAEEKAKRAGADAFLRKPLEKSRVLNTLVQSLKREP
jgi:two-component system response regulator MprA